VNHLATLRRGDPVGDEREGKDDGFPSSLLSLFFQLPDRRKRRKKKKKRREEEKIFSFLPVGRP